MRTGKFLAGIIVSVIGLVVLVQALQPINLEPFYGRPSPIAIFSGLAIFIGTCVAFVGLVQRKRVPPASPVTIIQQVAPSNPERVIVKETIKEVVKVKCPFCGTLVDHLQSTCPNCSGILK